MVDVPFWTYESRREKRDRELEQLNRLAESVRPQIQAGDYETAATAIRGASSRNKTDYQRKLDSIMAGRGAPQQAAPVAEQPKKKSRGGLFGKLKDVGGALTGIPGVGEAAHVANVGLQKLNVGSELVQGTVVAPWGDLKLDSSGKPVREFSKRSFVGGLEMLGKDFVTAGLAREGVKRGEKENAIRRAAGQSISGGGILGGFGRLQREGQSVQESNLPAGVKVGLNIAADPTAWVGPGALKAVTGGARLGRAGRVAGALLEQPASVTAGAAVGGGVAAQLAESSGHRNLVPLAAIGGSLVGGSAPSVLRRAPGAAVGLDARINEPAGSRLVTAGSSAEVPGSTTVYHGRAKPLPGGTLTADKFVTPSEKDAWAYARAEARLHGGEPQVYAFDAAPGALKPTGVDDLASSRGAQLVADPSKLTARGAGGPPIEPPATGEAFPNPRRYTVPEIGRAGAEKAIADKTLVLGTETGWEKAPPIFRKGAALVNPSLEQDRKAYLAHNAKLGTRAQLKTRFDATMEPHVVAVERAMEATPGVYIGPESNAIRGTFKDIADHPDHYVIPPQLRQALDDYDRANWEAVSAYVREWYGVDVLPFDNGIPGSIYAPTIPKRDPTEAKIDAASASLSSKSRAKQRAYAGAYDRMAKNPDFVPETGIRELTAIHNQAMASNAANETFKIGAGGLDTAAMMQMTHPALVEQKANAVKRVNSFAGRLETAEVRTARNQALATELNKPLDRLNGGVKTRAQARATLSDAKKELSLARRDADADARALQRQAVGEAKAVGRADVRSGQASAKLTKLLNRADTLGERIRTLEGKLGGVKGKEETLARWGSLTGDNEVRASIIAARKEARSLAKQIDAEYRAGFSKRALPVESAATSAERAAGARGAATGALESTTEAGQRFGTFTKGTALRAQAAAIDAALDTAPEEVYRTMNQMERRVQTLMTRADYRGGEAQTLRTEWEAAKSELDKLVQAWKTADPARGTDYVYDPATFRYYTPEGAKSVKQLLAVPTGGVKSVLETMDEFRAFHLSGDAGPLWVQAMMGVLQDPIMGMRTAGKVLGENPSAALKRIAREEADDVAEFTFHTGIPFSEPIAEMRPPRGLARIPKLGNLDTDMFAIVRRFQYEQWRVDRDLLLKMNPGMERMVAGRDAINAGSKIIPSLSTAERGVSGLRGAAERGLITSTSFAAAPALLLKDMTKGIGKLIASTSIDPATRWRGLTGVEQIAVLRGTTLIGSLTTLSLTSAALAAQSRGMTPTEAMKEALDPKSRYFMAIQVGKGASIPIGGPLRGFVKALYPGDHNIPGERLPQWASRKFTAPITGTYSLLTNKDWKGDAIAQGNALEQLARSVSYAVEQIAPISVGTALEGARAGLPAAEIAVNSIGGLLGSNAALPSPTEQLNQKARSMFPREGGYYDLEPAKQKAIRDANPGLWNEAVARGSDQRKRAEELKQRALKEQQGDDELVLSGRLSPEEWKAGRDDRRTALYAARSEAYGGGEPPDARDPVLRGYYQSIDASKVNGRIDWDQVDEYKASLSEADQQKIAGNTGLGGTPLERLRSSLSSSYYELPSYRGYTADQARQIDSLWVLTRNNARSAEDVYMLRALKQVTADGSAGPVVVKGARKRILGILRDAPDRQAWLKRHPEAVIFRGQAPLNAAQVEAVRKALAA